ncbi:MAG: DNA alkylation repair protein [Microthrixaceae bacterium]
MTATSRELADTADADLRAAGDPERAEKERAYLKSDLEHYGSSVPAVRRVATRLCRAHPGLDSDGVVELVELLWEDPVHERRLAAIELLVAYRDRLGAEDMALFERLLRDSRTWALVDPLAANVVGPVVDASPVAAEELDRWSVDADFWIRRASLLALLVPLRQGAGDFDRFARYADSMLDEQEFFICKAIGWVLRDTGKRRPDLVHEWLLPRAARCSGVTIREAVKPLSDDQRAAVLAVPNRRTRNGWTVPRTRRSENGGVSADGPGSGAALS